MSKITVSVAKKGLDGGFQFTIKAGREELYSAWRPGTRAEVQHAARVEAEAYGYLDE